MLVTDKENTITFPILVTYLPHLTFVHFSHEGNATWFVSLINADNTCLLKCS